jgi:hypothetical protein
VQSVMLAEAATTSYDRPRFSLSGLYSSRCFNFQDHATFRDSVLNASCQTQYYDLRIQNKMFDTPDFDYNDTYVPPFNVVALLTTDHIFDKGVALAATLLSRQIPVTVIAWEGWMPDSLELHRYILAHVPYNATLKTYALNHPMNLLKVHVLPVSVVDQPCWIRHDYLDMGFVSPVDHLECSIRNAPGLLRAIQPYVSDMDDNTILIDDGRTLPGLLLAERLGVPLIGLVDDIGFMRLILGPPPTTSSSSSSSRGIDRKMQWSIYEQHQQWFRDLIYSLRVSQGLLRSYNDLRRELGLPPVLKISRIYQNVGSLLILSGIPYIRSWQSPSNPQILIYDGPLIPPCTLCEPVSKDHAPSNYRFVFHFPTTRETVVNRPLTRLAVQAISLAKRTIHEWPITHYCLANDADPMDPANHIDEPTKACLSNDPLNQYALSESRLYHFEVRDDISALHVTRISSDGKIAHLPLHMRNYVQYIFDSVTHATNWVVALCSKSSTSSLTRDSSLGPKHSRYPHEEKVWWWPEYLGTSLICVDPEQDKTAEPVAASIVDHLLIANPDLPPSPLFNFTPPAIASRQAYAAKNVTDLIFHLSEHRRSTPSRSTHNTHYNPGSYSRDAASRIQRDTLRGIPEQWRQHISSDILNNDYSDLVTHNQQRPIQRLLLVLAGTILSFTALLWYICRKHASSETRVDEWWKPGYDELVLWAVIIQQWWRRNDSFQPGASMSSASSSLSPPSSERGFSTSRHVRKQSSHVGNHSHSQQQHHHHHHNNGHSKTVKKKH